MKLPGRSVAPPPSKPNARQTPTHQVLFPYGVGIDTHSKFIQVCILFQRGRDVKRTEQEFGTSWPNLLKAKKFVEDFLRKHKLLKSSEKLRYCIESTGTYHLPVLKAFGGIPCVVNPLLAGPTRRKTDVLDAQLLAHHSITGVWKPSFIPTEQAQQLRVLWSQRREAMRKATRASNRINNIVLRFGHTYGAEASMRQQVSQSITEALLDGEIPKVPGVCPDGLPEDVRAVVAKLHKDMQEAIIETRLAEKCAHSFVAEHEWPNKAGKINGKQLLSLLCTVPGVGTATALTWVAEVTDPTRFENSKQVGAYAGCDPSLKVSAGKVTSQTRRAGNTRLHLALLYAASGILRKPNDKMGMWGRSIAGRHKKGGYRKACGALARRVACGLWYVHMKGEPFSYEGYSLGQKVVVKDETVLQAFPARVAKLLREAGYTTTQHVADAYFEGKLASINGLGEQTISLIKTWLSLNNQRKELHYVPRPKSPVPQTNTSAANGSGAQDAADQKRAVLQRQLQQLKIR